MSESYYKPCRELDICNQLIEKYFNTRQYKKCFEGHLALAEQGYPLAECQIGYFYCDGLGVEKDYEKRSIGHAGPPTTATVTDNATLLGSMRKLSVLNVTWSRQSFGIERQPCRITTLQSKNAGNLALI